GVQLIYERIYAIKSSSRPHHVEVKIRTQKDAGGGRKIRRCGRQLAPGGKEQAARLGILAVFWILGDDKVADDRAQRDTGESVGLAEQHLRFRPREPEPR